jgi:hypothetical protein
MVAVDVKTGIDAKTDTNAKINIDTDELISDFPHTPRKFLINIMPA